MHPRTKQVLEAIQARIIGDWDHPSIVAMGPLHTDPLDDIALWAHDELLRDESESIRALDTTTARFTPGERL